MDDDNEVFKNTRGIYARYCSDTFRGNTELWEGMNEDVFLQAILGHESTNEIKHYRQIELSHEQGADWVKVKEESDEEEQDSTPKEEAKQNWRATHPIKQLNEKIDALNDEPIMVKVGSMERPVKVEKIRHFHNKKLMFWVAQNPTLKITQSAVEKNKGNTLSSGTGKVDIKVNRFIFRAWLAAVGADNVEAYNAGKS